MGAYLHDKRCPCNDTLMLEIAVLTGTLPIQGNIEYSWYRSDGGAGAREGGKVWREKRRRESGAQIPSAVGHAIVFPNCTFPIASVWNSFSLFSSPLWFSLSHHHHSPLSSFLPPPLYFVFLFFLSFSFFFLLLSFPPSFPLPVFPSVVNPQGLRGIWALRICGVPCRSGIRLVRYAASSRTPRRIRRIRYFALFPPIFAPLSQGTVSNSLWSSQHLSRYRVDSPGTFPFLRSFRFVSSSNLLFFSLSLSLFSFSFRPLLRSSHWIGKDKQGRFFSLWKISFRSATKSIVIFNSFRDFDFVLSRGFISFLVKISGQRIID